MLAWIIVSELAVSLIALVGSLTLVLKQTALDRILLPLVAFAAGSLIGGALFHMIPASVHQMGNDISVYGAHIEPYPRRQMTAVVRLTTDCGDSSSVGDGRFAKPVLHQVAHTQKVFDEPKSFLLAPLQA